MHDGATLSAAIVARHTFDSMHCCASVVVNIAGSLSGRHRVVGRTPDNSHFFARCTRLHAVHADDPEFRDFTDISELPQHRLHEIRRCADGCWAGDALNKPLGSQRDMREGAKLARVIRNNAAP